MDVGYTRIEQGIVNRKSKLDAGACKRVGDTKRIKINQEVLGS